MYSQLLLSSILQSPKKSLLQMCSMLSLEVFLN